jgi:mono/diheme cytochrome c family protein
VASGYGNVLLSKALLFCVAVGIGAINYFLVRAGSLRRSLPLIGLELAIGTVAVLAAAGLVSGQPSANRQPVPVLPALRTLHLYGEVGPSSVHAAIDLPAPGNQRYQVGVAELATGTPRTDVQRVILVFDPPSGSGLAPERVELESADDPALWATRGAYTPVVGDWDLEVIVRRVGELDESVSFPMTVSEPGPPGVVPPPDIGVGVPIPLASAWAVLPEGGSGWLLVIGLLIAAALLGLVARSRPAGWLSALRASVVVATVLIGLVVASRAVVDAANQTPAAEASRPNPVAGSAESIERGERLYLANCAACHGGLGDGGGPTALRIGMPLDPLGDIIPALTDGEIAYRIAVGTVGSGMPAFASTLSESDRWDLVNYLRDTFGSPRR